MKAWWWMAAASLLLATGLVPVARAAQGPSAWQIVDPANDAGVVAESGVAYVSTPGSDVLRLGFYENETHMSFAVALSAVSPGTRNGLGFMSITTFSLAKPDSAPQAWLVILMDEPNVSPDPSILVLATRTGTSGVGVVGSATLDEAKSTMSVHLPWDAFARGAEGVPMGSVIKDPLTVASEVQCTPATVDRWSCSWNAIQTAGQDYAPHSGTMPLGRGTPYNLTWSSDGSALPNSSAPNTTMASEANKVPEGPTPPPQIDSMERQTPAAGPAWGILATALAFLLRRRRGG